MLNKEQQQKNITKTCFVWQTKQPLQTPAWFLLHWACACHLFFFVFFWSGVCAASSDPVASCFWSRISRRWPSRRATRTVNICETSSMTLWNHVGNVFVARDESYTIIFNWSHIFTYDTITVPGVLMLLKNKLKITKTQHWPFIIFTPFANDQLSSI